jgi:hypothetical protein
MNSDAENPSALISLYNASPKLDLPFCTHDIGAARIRGFQGFRVFQRIRVLGFWVFQRIRVLGFSKD